MKNIFLIMIHIISICLFLSCTNLQDPLSEYNDFSTQNSTIRVIKKGIYLQLEGIRDTYSLQDTISGKMVLFNRNNPRGLDIHVGNSPPISSYLIFDQNDQVQFYYPSVTGMSVFDMNLLPGDILNQKIEWKQYTNSTEIFPRGLSVYSGHYKIVGGYRGNELLNQIKLTKWIEITEEGDPISSVIARHYEVEDSIKLSFIVRNRISIKQIFNLKDDYPFSYCFVSIKDSTDTLIYKKFENVPNFEEQFILNPKTDINIFCFRISKNDPILAEVSCPYRVTFLLQCEEREIKRSTSVYF